MNNTLSLNAALIYDLHEYEDSNRVAEMQRYNTNMANFKTEIKLDEKMNYINSKYA